MATAVKDLTVLDSVIELKCNSDAALDGHGSQVGVSQYISGAGTIQVEATTQATDPAVWIPPLDITTGAAIAAQIAPGILYFRISGFLRVRTRKTVGGAALIAGLGVD